MELPSGEFVFPLTTSEPSRCFEIISSGKAQRQKDFIELLVSFEASAYFSVA
jgi:hypothetical protein